MSDKFSLANKVAIVTGAGRGIGRGIALALAEAGADVLLAARSLDQLEQVAGEVRERGREAVALAVDVTKEPDIDRMVAQCLATFGHIDVLVNSAGIVPAFTAAERLSREMWDNLTSVNLGGVFFCSQAVGKVMIRHKKGSIVNVASVAGLCGAARLAGYAATKGGIVQITKTLAVEWGRHNIRVNAIAPGVAPTESARGWLDNEGFMEHYVASVPLGRVGSIEEIAGPVVFLASDASSFITGTTLPIDGGYTAW